ncbi:MULTISPECIES: hypothetical protein [Agromyces]|nr:MULTISPECIES: hypothetical protein [Agromyces]
MSGRWSRVARGFAVAVASTYVAVFAHVLGGGAPPSWIGVTATVMIGVPICSALAGRRVRFLQSAAGVAATQYLFHALFSASPAPMSPAPMIDGSAGHDHFAQGNVTLVVGQDVSVDGMSAAHAMSALVTLAFLRSVDAVFKMLAASAARFHERVVRRSGLVVLHPEPLLSRVPAMSWPDLLSPPSRSIVIAPRRGPPLAAR